MQERIQVRIWIYILLLLKLWTFVKKLWALKAEERVRFHFFIRVRWTLVISQTKHNIETHKQKQLRVYRLQKVLFILLMNGWKHSVVPKQNNIGKNASLC